MAEVDDAPLTLVVAAQVPKEEPIARWLAGDSEDELRMRKAQRRGRLPSRRAPATSEGADGLASSPN
jgi:hypothetical protein